MPCWFAFGLCAMYDHLDNLLAIQNKHPGEDFVSAQ